jgi:hypothetical protein
MRKRFSFESKEISSAPGATNQPIPQASDPEQKASWSILMLLGAGG